MKALLATLLALGLVACRHVDEKRRDLVLDEIATIGSEAKLPGPRSPAEVDRIEVQVQILEKHYLEDTK